MNRKDFLKGVGLTGVSLALPASRFGSCAKKAMIPNDICTLIPSETAGPFPLDLTENQTFFRQDIRETEEGIQLNLRLKIVGVDNCEPMQNVRVNIWHCDKDGVYSGYNTGNNQGDPNGTQLRGYQFTDANGEVEFVTIFPGWYNGRICHIHFQVYVSSTYSAISQLTFPIDIKNALYANNPNIYTKGADPLSFAQDNIFADGHDYQLASLEEDTNTGAYSSYMEIAVQGSGTTSIGHIEKETLKVFELGQNYPNPYKHSTVIPVNLLQSSDISLELWSLSGQKIASIFKKENAIGNIEIEFDPVKFGLASGNYVYQFVAKNNNGIYRLPKMMTYQK